MEVLNEAIIGAQKGVTHYLVARQTNLAEWLKGREGSFKFWSRSSISIIISRSS